MSRKLLHSHAGEWGLLRWFQENSFLGIRYVRPLGLLGVVAALFYFWVENAVVFLVLESFELGFLLYDLWRLYLAEFLVGKPAQLQICVFNQQFVVNLYQLVWLFDILKFTENLEIDGCFAMLRQLLGWGGEES